MTDNPAILDLAPADDLVACATASEAVERLIHLYDDAIDQITARFDAYVAGTLDETTPQTPTYPYLCAIVSAEKSTQTSKLALGGVASESLHGTAITRPKLYTEFLTEELTRIVERFDAKLFVGMSHTPMPLTFALEKATSALTAEMRASLQQYFHMPNLVSTNDDIVDGHRILQRFGAMPLTLFSCLLYTSPSPRDLSTSRMPSSA